MTTLSQSPHANSGKRLLLACWYNQRHTDYRCPPEQASPSSPIYDEVDARVTLTYAIPAGMTGTVHIDWFDPDNPRGSTIVPNHNGLGKRDNHGSIKSSDNNNCVTFKVGDGLYKNKGFEIISAPADPNDPASAIYPHAGDNYIVAAHPNAGVVQRAIIDTNNSVIKNNIVIPISTSGGSGGSSSSSSSGGGSYSGGYSSGGYISGGSGYMLPKTSVLTVWRTLNC